VVCIRAVCLGKGHHMAVVFILFLPFVLKIHVLFKNVNPVLDKALRNPNKYPLLIGI
jgi:hypothetical protein